MSSSEEYHYFKNTILAATDKCPEILTKVDLFHLVRFTIWELNLTTWYVVEVSPALELNASLGNVIYIGTKAKFPVIRVKGYCVNFIIQKNEITGENLPYFYLLDCIHVQKKLFQTQLEYALDQFQNSIGSLLNYERKILMRLARKYQPFVRCYLALICLTVGGLKEYYKLSESISPKVLSKYITMMKKKQSQREAVE